jgi:hypothetical protein
MKFFKRGAPQIYWSESCDGFDTIRHSFLVRTAVGGSYADFLLIQHTLPYRCGNPTNGYFSEP